MKEIIDELERLGFGYWDDPRSPKTRTYHSGPFLISYKNGTNFLTYDDVFMPNELSGKKVYTLEQFRKDYEWYLDYMVEDTKKMIDHMKKKIKLLEQKKKEYAEIKSVHI